MKKFFTLALTAVMALSLLTACGSKDNASDDNKGEEGGTTAALSSTVSTDGSTSMEKVINSLGESFMAANKDVKFTYNPTGSGSGIQAVTEGRCDIGLSSRALKDDEKASGLVETVLAYDGIAIVVSPENPVSDLDVDTIAKIYTGEITNWKDVGINTVSQNPDAIGYASLSAVGESVKALTVGGVKASEATVKDGSYVVQRPFVLVTKEGTELSPAAQAFFDYAISPEVADIIANAGAVAAN